MVHLAMLTGADIPDFSLRPVLMKRLSIIGSTLRARTPDFQAELTRRFKDEVLGEIRGEDAKEDDGQLRAYTYRVSCSPRNPSCHVCAHRQLNFDR